MFRLVKVRFDGQPLWVEVREETSRLSDMLRSIGKTGPKSNCSTGRCGACIVMIGDRPVKSCSVLTETCAGADVWTADHLDFGPGIHPMLVAFRRHCVPACDACMPGMLVAAIAYAARNRELTEEEISQELVADMCQCKHAPNIVVAVHEGARIMHELRPMETGSLLNRPAADAMSLRASEENKGG